tara:strand:+ start:291 stop:656 length:366 start_codon:yes stop_codon:yes gene_type:complete
MKKTKKQLLSEVRNLQARDKAWIKDYNKLQKQLDKADQKVYNLEIDKSTLENKISELEYNSKKYKEERDINANDIEYVKHTKDHMELQYLKQIANLQNRVINNLENASTPAYVNGSTTITT